MSLVITLSFDPQYTSGISEPQRNIQMATLNRWRCDVAGDTHHFGRAGKRDSGTDRAVVDDCAHCYDKQWPLLHFDGVNSANVAAARWICRCGRSSLFE